MLTIQLKKYKKVYKKNGKLQIILFKNYRRFLTLGFLQRASVFRISAAKYYNICLMSFNFNLYSYWSRRDLKIPLWLNQLVPFFIVDAVLYFKIFSFYLNQFSRIINKFYASN